MSQVTGFLVKQSEKPTSNGGVIYNICVEVDGADEWFGYGFDAPTFGVDSEIEFDVEVNGKFENVIVETLNIIENVNAPAAPARKARGGAKPAGRGAAKPARAARGAAAAPPARTPRGAAKEEAPAKTERAPKKADVDWDRKDNLIRLQSCQNTAIATIKVLVEAGAVTLPAKKPAKYDAMVALIEKEAHRLFIKYDECADGVYDHDGDVQGAADNGDYDDGDEIPE